MLIIAPGQEALKYIFSIFFNLNVYCVFSLESPHRGDSNEYTQYILFYIKIKSPPKIKPNLQLCFFSTGLKNQFETAVVNISVRATKGLLYIFYSSSSLTIFNEFLPFYNHLRVNRARASYNLNYSRARAYCAYSRCGWGLFGHFYSPLSFLSSFSLSLGDGPI